MKKILTDAREYWCRNRTHDCLQNSQRRRLLYPNSGWPLPFFGGYKFEVAPGVSNLDGAAFFYYLATGVTPADGIEDGRRRVFVPVD